MDRRMDLNELLNRNVASGQVLAPLSKAAGLQGWEYMPDAVNESGEAIGTGIADRQQLMSSPLAGYTFDWQDTGPANTGTLTAFDPSGKRFGAYNQQDQSTNSALAEFAALAAAGFGGLGALGLGPMAGLLGGAGAAGGAAVEGAAAAGAADIGALGLAEGVYGAGGALGAGVAPGTVGGLAGSTAGFGGLGSVLPASVGYGAAGAGALGATGLDAMRAGEIAGYSTNGSIPGSAAVPTGTGGLLGSLPQGVQNAAAWMKANPQLGRLLMGGATSLLSGAGGGSGSSGAPSGPPVQWNSGLQQGLLSPVQQYAPAAITQNRPAGLLAQGYQNDGAHRYLKG